MTCYGLYFELIFICSIFEPDTEDEDDDEADNKKQRKNRNKDKSHARFVSPSRGGDMDKRIKKLEEQMSRWSKEDEMASVDSYAY